MALAQVGGHRRRFVSPISILAIALVLFIRNNAISPSNWPEKQENAVGYANDSRQSFPWPENSNCSDVHKYKNQSCEFIHNVTACQFDGGFMNYLAFIYCGDIPSSLIPLGMTLLFLWLIVLFIALGTTAEEFLCPSLTVISQTLHLNQNVAGVTFLALGNGAPDIFSAFAAVKAAKRRPGGGHDISLAIGALFGAGIFVSTVVVGAICIASPFSLTSRPFLRDVIFYLAAATWTFAILWRGKMYLGEALGFIGLYVLYVIVVVLGRYIYQKRKKRLTGRGDIPSPLIFEEGKELKTGSVSSSSPSPEAEITANGDLGESGVEWKPTIRSPDQISTNSDITSLEESQSRRKTTPFKKKAPLRRRSSSLPDINKSLNDHDDDDDDAKLKRIQELRRKSRIKRSTFRLASALDTTETVGIAFLGHPEVAHPTSPVAKRRRHRETGDDEETVPLLSASTNSALEKETTENSFLFGLKGISPIKAEEWKDRGTLGRILDVVKVPVLFVLLFTNPVVDYDETDRRWNKWLNVWHCLIAPVFTLAIIQKIDFLITPKFPLAVLLLAIGLLLAVSVALTSKPFQPPIYHAAFAFMGFGLSVLWIYAIANEIVNVLQTIGAVFRITNGLLGLTLLAWANSIGDFIADLTMARQGFPRMGIAACFGGPLLNLLLGLGISSTYMCLKDPGHIFRINSLTTVEFFCVIFLMGSLSISLVIVTVFLKFRVNRKFGIVLICYYVVFVVLACLGETQVIRIF